MPSLSSSKSGSSPGSSSHRSASSSKKLSSGASLRPKKGLSAYTFRRLVEKHDALRRPKQMISTYETGAAGDGKADKEQMLRSLRTHRINTLTELRRIEKLMQDDTSKDTTEAMTTAWAHYVNSNNLLSELRGMTKNYPFSSECLDEAKWQVIGDPSSSRSWNYCWLILTKIKTESLIKKHARLQAAKPAMWGGKAPSSANVEKLANACVSEWNRAVDNMLKQWSTPPKVSK